MPPAQTLQQLRDRRAADPPPQMVVPPPPLKAFASPALRYIAIAGYLTSGGCKDKVVCLLANDIIVAGPTGMVNANVPYASLIDIARQQYRQNIEQETVVFRYRPAEGKPPKALALRFDASTALDDLLGAMAFLAPGGVKLSTKSSVEKPIETTIAAIAESQIAKIARSASSSRENAQLLSEAREHLRERPKTRIAFDAGSSATTAAYRARIVRLYQQYCPEKAQRGNAIEEALVTFRGDEETLMRALVKKYGPEPTSPEPTVQHDDKHRAVDVVEDEGGEKPPGSPATIQTRLPSFRVPPQDAVDVARPSSPISLDHRDIQPRAVLPSSSSPEISVAPVVELKRGPLTLANLEAHLAVVGSAPVLGRDAVPAGSPLGSELQAQSTLSHAQGGSGRAEGDDQSEPVDDVTPPRATQTSAPSPLLDAVTPATPAAHEVPPLSASGTVQVTVDKSALPTGTAHDAVPKRLAANSTAAPQPTTSPRNAQQDGEARGEGKRPCIHDTDSDVELHDEANKAVADVFHRIASSGTLSRGRKSPPPPLLQPTTRAKATRHRGRSGGEDVVLHKEQMDAAAIAMIMSDLVSLRHEMDTLRRGSSSVGAAASPARAANETRDVADATPIHMTVASPTMNSDFDTDADEPEARPPTSSPRGRPAQTTRSTSHPNASSARLEVTAALSAVKEAFSAAGRALDAARHTDPTFVREFNRLDGPLNALHVALRPFLDERVIAAAAASGLSDRTRIDSRPQREVYLKPAWVAVDLGEVNRQTYPSTKKYHRLIFEQQSGPGTRSTRNDDPDEDAMVRLSRRAAQVPESEIVIATRSQHATRYGGWVIPSFDILSVCPGAVRRLPTFAGGASGMTLYDASNPLPDNPLLRGASLSEQGGYSRSNGVLRDRPDDELSVTMATRQHVLVLEFDDAATRNLWLGRLVVLLQRNRQCPWFHDVAPSRPPSKVAATSSVSPRRHGIVSAGTPKVVMTPRLASPSFQRFHQDGTAVGDDSEEEDTLPPANHVGPHPSNQGLQRRNSAEDEGGGGDRASRSPLNGSLDSDESGGTGRRHVLSFVDIAIREMGDTPHSSAHVAVVAKIDTRITAAVSHGEVEEL